MGKAHRSKPAQIILAELIPDPERTVALELQVIVLMPLSLTWKNGRI